MWKLYTVILFMCRCATPLPAQVLSSGGSLYSQQTFIGVCGGYGYSLQNGIQIQNYRGVSSPEFPSTFLPIINTGIAFETAEVKEHLSMSSLQTQWEKYSSSWLFQCEYQHIQGSMEQSSENLLAFRPFAGDTMAVAATMEAEVVISNFQVNVFRKYRLSTLLSAYYSPYSSWISPFYIAIGGTIGYSLSGRIQQRARLIDSTNQLLPVDGGRIEEQGRSIVFQETDIPVSSRLRLGLKAAIQYEIKVFPSSLSPVNVLTLMPTLSFEYPIVNAGGKYTFNSLSAQIGLVCSFAIDNPLVYDDFTGLYITPAEFSDSEYGDAP